jgi:enoyl-CoA hydratase/carnithine racemase
MPEDLILRDEADGIATLTLNAPTRLNALSDAMLTGLSAALTAAGADTTIRVIILRGAGRAFCAGHDLTEMQAARAVADKGAAYFAELFARCSALMQMIPALPQPVIAEVHGIATAAGCQLAASCDMVVAADTARFGVNGVNVGLFCSTPMVALTRAVPAKAAFELLVTGEFIPADRARDLGLVNRVVPADRLSQETRALALTVASKMTAVVRIGKRAFHDQRGLPLADAYAMMVENMLWRETEDGIAAFLNRGVPPKA